MTDTTQPYTSARELSAAFGRLADLTDGFSVEELMAPAHGHDEANETRDRPELRARRRSFHVQLKQLSERGMPYITAYLAGRLNVAEMRQIEIALADPLADLIFGGVIAAWRAPEAPDAKAPDVDAAYARFVARRNGR